VIFRCVRRVGFFLLLAALAVPASSPGQWPAISEDEDAAGFRGAGRAVMNIAEQGLLCSWPEAEGGLRWPGEGGREFLGAGGLLVRYSVGTGDSLRLSDPTCFDVIEGGFSGRGLLEGCEGGKRYPNRDCDDDGDGVSDEDEYDGLDNDGDGLVDEDFAAVGSQMTVIRAEERNTGLVLTQNSYTWSYPHVRDFIGFTTKIEYGRGGGADIPELRIFEIFMYMDFSIGDPDDRERGIDDIYSFVRYDCDGGAGQAAKRPGVIMAASDGCMQPFVGMLVLRTEGPSGIEMEADGSVIEAAGNGRQMNDRITGYERKVKRMGTPVLQTGLAGAEAYRYARLVEGAAAPEIERGGDRAFMCRLEAVPCMKPGDGISVEWALVFGETKEDLIRNAQLARETFDGVVDESGRTHSWVVPARRIVRMELEAELASVWAGGKGHPAAAVALPHRLAAEELEWLRVEGKRTDEYERAGAKIIVCLEENLVGRGGSIEVEGQLSDGTIFTATLDREALVSYDPAAVLPPGRLPDDMMRIFPNPFLDKVKIDLHYCSADVAEAGDRQAGGSGLSSIKIYDVRGRLVRTILEDEFLHPGDYSMGWDGMDDQGVELAPGAYYCKLQVGSRSLTKRVILLR